MKILIVGATGTIGTAVVEELSKRHTVISASHHQGDLQVDITNHNSILEMFQKIGQLDAVVATTGKIAFAKLNEMDEKKYQFGLNHKLMGQVNLVLLGLPFINAGGSFTLTSGIVSSDPILYGTSAAMVNGAVEAFTKSAAIDLPRGIRINTVSPTVLKESMDKYADYFRGYKPVSAKKVALAYSKSVEGAQTGQVYRAGW